MSIRILLLFLCIWGNADCKKSSRREPEIVGKNRVFRRVIKDDLLKTLKNDIKSDLTKTPDRSRRFVQKMLAVLLTVDPLQIRIATAFLNETLHKTNVRKKPLLVNLKSILSKEKGENDIFDDILKVWLLIHQDKSGVFRDLEGLVTLKNASKIDMHLNRIVSNKKNLNLKMKTKGIVEQLDFHRGDKKKTRRMAKAYTDALTEFKSPNTARGKTYRRYIEKNKRHQLTDLLIDICGVFLEYKSGDLLSILQIFEVYIINYIYQGSKISGLFASFGHRQEFNQLISYLGEKPDLIKERLRIIQRGLEYYDWSGDHSRMSLKNKYHNFALALDETYATNKNHTIPWEILTRLFYFSPSRPAQGVPDSVWAGYYDININSMEPHVKRFMSESIFKHIDSLDNKQIQKLKDSLVGSEGKTSSEGELAPPPPPPEFDEEGIMYVND